MIDQNVKIEVNVEPAGLQMRADADRIRQVVVNLLENAIRVSPESSLVELTAEEQGNDIIIVVADQGPGIAAEDRRRIFERFYRADPSRTSSNSGLGLAIVKWIVELHGGSVSPHDNKPCGCRMVVQLPKDIND